VPSEASPIYRFGIFELDPRNSELRKGGVRLKLQDQPYQVLLKLLEHRGELVSREELRSTLWPADTFVDFETGLNTAVKRLRETLGDSADNPTFIETVPRRGYKFIAPAGISASQESKTLGPAGQLETPPRKNLPKRGSVLIGFAAVVLALLLIGVALWYGQPRPPTVTNVVRITNDGKAKIPMNSPVTDGVHLYFIEGEPWTSGSGIAQMSATGGETSWIAAALKDVLAIYSMSPDRSELLVVKGVAVGSDDAGELWVQPLPAGAPHRVGNVLSTAACWTPDGTHIVYAYQRTVMIANKDGSEPRELAKVPGVARALRFSPDGRRIRFWVIQPPEMESGVIWEMKADGKNLHPFFADWKKSPYQCCGNWSPDGDYYYFEAGRGDGQAIWVAPGRSSLFGKNTASPSLLISGPLRFSSPVPSGDGKRLFVVGEERRVELFRYDLKTGHFDSYLKGLSAGPVDFSSDGKWIAYVSYPDMTLWRSRLDGSEKTQLTLPPVRAYEPRWSPDGSKIAFLDVQFHRPWKISLISATGGGTPEFLVPGSDDKSESDPTWMPDGKSIVFGKSEEIDKVSMAIYSLDLNTRAISQVPDSHELFSPRVSPDGRYICALKKGQAELMLFDTETNHWSSLGEGGARGYNEWSHDGKYVYMRETKGGAAEVVRVRIKDGVLEDVFSLKDFPQVIDMFAGWIGLTPDDAPLLMRDRSVQEIYALDLHFH
jgi:Tol biopolymer transport system component/DNA-binding winged helix-turn-helix (wHTH) protein